jgi:hypothetical protein
MQVNRLRVPAVLLGTAIAGAVLAAASAATADAATAAPAGTAARTAAATTTAATTVAGHVVLVGIGGLRWTDVSAATTPQLWHLAGAGSVGSLVVHVNHSVTCPADGWLTLNAGTRASLPRPPSDTCEPMPAVVTSGTAHPGVPSPARIPAMHSLTVYNQQFHYGPDWGLLASAAGPGGCSTAIGPGAALALASPQGQVSGYLPSVTSATRATYARCPITAVDLGTLPSSAGPARTAAARADDRDLGQIARDLPPGTTLVVTATGDNLTAHLRTIVVDGPGYADGLLHTASTRQPGLTQIPDITASVLRWRGRPIPGSALGSPLTRGSRASLVSTVRGLIGQDTAAQVYVSTFGWFFAVFGVADAVAFGLIVLLARGSAERRRQRRRSAARIAGIVAGSVPAGTFLANLVPWWMLPHPALLLYLLVAAWTAVVATIALAGPWRRHPLGPPGVIGLITVGVVAIDVMTGSRLELDSPYGINVLWGGRFFGEDNNTVGIYAACAILGAAWLAALLLSREPERTGRLSPRAQAVLAVAVVSLFAITASGWPGFGAKVGGTIATVPSLLILLAAVAGVRITWRRGIILAVSGLLVIAAFGLVNYFVPITGHSDIGAFAGQALHGGGGGTLQRKIATNFSSLTGTPFSWIIPLAVVVFGVVLLRPDWFRARLLTEARRAVPLLGVTLASIWVVALLGWFAEDSGVGVPGAMLPLVLPLAIAIMCSVPPATGDRVPGSQGGRTATATSRAS